MSDNGLVYAYNRLVTDPVTQKLWKGSPDVGPERKAKNDARANVLNSVRLGLAKEIDLRVREKRGNGLLFEITNLGANVPSQNPEINPNQLPPPILRPGQIPSESVGVVVSRKEPSRSDSPILGRFDFR